MSGNFNSMKVTTLAAALGLVMASHAQAAEHQAIRAQMAATPQALLASRLGLGADSTLQARASAINVHGTRTVKMQQMYKGVPVYGRVVTVDQDAAGNALTAQGDVATNVEFDLASVTPKLRGAEAIAKLKQHRGLAALSTGALTTRNEKSDLYVLANGGAARLVYLTSYFSDNNGHPTRPHAIIDANTGAIIEQWEGLTHVNAGGPGGNAKTGQYTYGSNRPYFDVTQSGTTCTMNNSKNKTVNLNGGTSGTTAFSFTCPTNTVKAINGAYSPLNDAHFFGGVIYDMYTAYLGRSPLTFQLVQRVHYSSNYENAFWDGSQMNYGDGASTFYPLVSLDVASHEISHGFTEQNSNLQYSGQSGGMNEAFSDMSGEAAEYFSRGSANMLVGSEIFKASGALRYMCNPTQDGGSIDNAANYRSGMDVHYSSGVYNKAFCLLSQKTGWNVKTAWQAFARANDLYWSATETFNTGAVDVVKAACDLGFKGTDVAAAFTSVGVNAGTVPTSCGGTGGGGTGTTYTNGTDYTISDNATVDSPITVSGRTGNASATTSVSVNIVHTYQGDLKVDLVAPDGSLYNIHNRTGGSADNVIKTVTLNLSSEALNGTWKLRVNDNAGGDVGYINSWSITF